MGCQYKSLNQLSPEEYDNLDFHRRCKKINDRWWWVSIFKNASNTMEAMTIEDVPDADARFLAIIRNPFDRLVSCWEDKGERFKQGTFQHFVDYVCSTPDGIINAHAQSQMSFIDRPIDKFILFDSLQEDFKKIGIHINEHHNKSNNKSDWENYYTPELLVKVANRYEKDWLLYSQLCPGGAAYAKEKIRGQSSRPFKEDTKAAIEYPSRRLKYS